jgi:aminoglycoside/choline kinase family phosphotransferase
MLQRESGYFLRAFWQDLLGREPLAGIDEEFGLLADRAGQAPCEAFLHRDFQSRNIMVLGGRVRFIDFQGGRFGPLAYDVASLLLDPYAGLSPGLQEQLLGTYCRLVESRQGGGGALAATSYQWLALQRNLQIVGAFAFLWKVRCKPFFAAYLRPALASLHERLEHGAGAEFPLLRSMARQGLAAVESVAG